MKRVRPMCDLGHPWCILTNLSSLGLIVFQLILSLPACFHKNKGTFQNGWFLIRANPIRIDDLGVPLFNPIFGETPTSILKLNSDFFCELQLALSPHLRRLQGFGPWQILQRRGFHPKQWSTPWESWKTACIKENTIPKPNWMRIGVTIIQSPCQILSRYSDYNYDHNIPKPDPIPRFMCAKSGEDVHTPCPNWLVIPQTSLTISIG